MLVAHVYIKNLKNGNAELTINNFVAGEHKTHAFKLDETKGEKKKDEVCQVCHGKNIEGCSYCDIEGNE